MQELSIYGLWPVMPLAKDSGSFLVATVCARTEADARRYAAKFAEERLLPIDFLDPVTVRPVIAATFGPLPAEGFVSIGAAPKDRE